MNATETLSVVNGTVDTIKSVVTPLLAQLGELGQQGYELALRQNYIIGYEKLAGALLILLVYAMVCFLVHRAYKGMEYNDRKLVAKGFWDYVNHSDLDATTALIVLSTVATIVVLFPASMLLLGAIDRLANPNYATLMDIARIVGIR